MFLLGILGDLMVAFKKMRSSIEEESLMAMFVNDLFTVMLKWSKVKRVFSRIM